MSEFMGQWGWEGKQDMKLNCGDISFLTAA